MEVPAVSGIISKNALHNNELLKFNYEKMSRKEKQKMRNIICREILSENRTAQINNKFNRIKA